MKALLISNDPEISNVVSLSFGIHWPQMSLVLGNNGSKAAELVEGEKPDLIFLDISLRDADGLDVLRQIRAFCNTALLVVTSKNEEITLVQSLQLGADDYVVKPFSPIELLARAKAVLRRSNPDDLTFPVNFNHGRIVIDFQSQEVLLHNEEVKLTPTEYRLLCQLAINLGKTVSHKTLIERVWGEEYLEDPNVLKVHIHRLRRKLEDDPNNPEFIVTVPRRGYKFRTAIMNYPLAASTPFPEKSSD